MLLFGAFMRTVNYRKLLVKLIDLVRYLTILNDLPRVYRYIINSIKPVQRARV